MLRVVGMGWLLQDDRAVVLVAVAAYIAILLAVALRADRPSPGTGTPIGILSYGLTLSVLCTSWTYLGAVGLAMRGGWRYLPNFVGPVVVLALLGPVWQRIALACKRENVTSVADFIASRHGKDRLLGAVATVVAIVGALPYLVLQFVSLAKAVAVLAGASAPPWWATPLTVAFLGALAMIFGARRPSLTRHNRGLTRIVVIESVVKFTALGAVALLALAVLRRAPPSARPPTALMGPPLLDGSFCLATLLCGVTMFTLPRVFHLAFVTLDRRDRLAPSRWLFAGYMAFWAAAIVPIALAGAALPGVDPDLVVLQLPIAHGGRVLTALAFLGGFSAGATMVMVETIALSTMIANELILPWLARRHWGRAHEVDASSLILNVRRAAMIGVLTLSYLYFRRLDSATDLPHLGFASLAASAQLAPSIIGGVLWRGGHARGALWGIVTGSTVLLYAVLAPQLGAGHTHLPWFDALAAGAYLNPAIIVSLILNLLLYVTISLASTRSLLDRVQASAFVDTAPPALPRGHRPLTGTIADLRALLDRFLGKADAAQALHEFGEGQSLSDDATITPSAARIAERVLSGAIGASSARNVIALALAGEQRSTTDIFRILDEAASAVQFSQEVMQAALNGLDQGVTVVDRDLRLVAWNERYLELFGYDPAAVAVGVPMDELIRDSALRMNMSVAEQAVIAEQRLGPIWRREPQDFERQWPNGLILRVVGRPLSTGDYVTSFTDVTEMRHAGRALGRMNEELEARVAARTGELQASNAALAEASALAERVTSAQKKFVAAASHDLLQPLHAARLFIAAAGAMVKDAPRPKEALDRADTSIEAADRLLRALLNLSRIEIGGVAPEQGAVSIGALFDDLGREFEPVASEKGLSLRVVRSTAFACSNVDLLRSVLQNLLTNAIRYTDQGKVLIGARRRGSELLIEVCDTGRGIAPDARELIFREFTQLGGDGDAPGAGLGLTIADRICRTLAHRLSVRSTLGRGSVFSVALRPAKAAAVVRGSRSAPSVFAGLRVLCVEDQSDVRVAQALLLRQWGMVVTEAPTGEAAIAETAPFDVVIADYHLGGGVDGLLVLEHFDGRAPVRLLLTAGITDAVHDKAERLGITVLRKPVAPPALRSLLHHALRQLAPSA